ncbi:TetR family transcriptional regulator [Mycobacteroides chelonae]|uniref:TetR/AcrR family transcriptional regulator n=1 Tax=Mycobacteroides chelonae TaxID=1774 RepID=UPI0008A86494|nr:TetR/AcrR family transcriptional regulator [Mycobacteroides chelonae]PKQ58211.1 TetR family transcriptional regulator [Mycobacterium sp. MHSD3]MBF9519790.1 TetR/AcrR family transcriptional regulator [Mycobacteroides chelonae]MBV0920552.1 TetR/AcrR family transcriptional regulator [Mycobacteroides chelonae]OHT77175.1 TetR family transcriptional regulator [Mycobacteroides chelonae]OHU55680.1 TetR family transcriptional regulator [Mycobacteroides chelonae]
MPETKGRRQDRRTAVTTAAILDAAEGLFVERGFHAVTMDAIADTADLAVGSIYHHFKNKERLYLALVERALLVNEEAMARAFGKGRTPMEELRAASDAYCDFHLQNPGYFRMIALRTLDVPPGDMADEVERRIADKVESLVGDIADVLRRADAAGELHCADPVRTSIFLWGAWNGVLSLNLRPDRLRLEPAEMQRVLALGREIIERGLVRTKVL